MTTVQLKKSHPKLLGNIPIHNIQEHLEKVLHLPSCVAAKKLLLTPIMIRKRLAFAKKYVSWTKDDWSKVMFSDEISFRCGMARPGSVRRPQGSDRYDPKFTVKRVKHSDNIMVWASFIGRGGRGGACFL